MQDLRGNAAVPEAGRFAKHHELLRRNERKVIAVVAGGGEGAHGLSDEGGDLQLADDEARAVPLTELAVFPVLVVEEEGRSAQSDIYRAAPVALDDWFLLRGHFARSGSIPSGARQISKASFLVLFQVTVHKQRK